MTALDQASAEAFARSWLAAWNGADLDAICAHYAGGVRFRSPYVAALGHGPEGVLVGLPAVRAYFADGLARSPGLRFVLDDVLTGAGAVTLCYRNHRGQRVAETMVLGDAGVVDAVACYSGGRA